MTNEKILEIARTYGSYESVHYEDDEPTQFRFEWSFISGDELLAFAKAIIEADRESSDEPVAWFTSNGTLTHDPLRGITPLYTRPAPALEPLSDEEVEEEFNRRCELDCCPDFSEAVRWAEKMHGIGEAE